MRESLFVRAGSDSLSEFRHAQRSGAGVCRGGRGTTGTGGERPGRQGHGRGRRRTRAPGGSAAVRPKNSERKSENRERQALFDVLGTINK